MPKSIVVFDEYITSDSGLVYTSDRFDSVMAQHDEITLCAVLDQVSVGTSPGFDCWVQMSPDSRLWIERRDVAQAQPPPAAATTGDLSLSEGSTYKLVGDRTNTIMFSDACLGVSRLGTSNIGPLLGFVRLAIRMNDAAAHVRIHYAGRPHLA